MFVFCAEVEELKKKKRLRIADEMCECEGYNREIKEAFPILSEKKTKKKLVKLFAYFF